MTTIILNVHTCPISYIINVQELFGRRSQDPYALVYLLGGNGLAKFQIDNNSTKTFDKNIKPDMKHDFYFKVEMICKELKLTSFSRST